MARCLVIACGCRGMTLARELMQRGHAVRATTRHSARVDELKRLGAEAVVADPDRVATLVGALDHVSVACVLLGSASGSMADLQALHSTRLEMLLAKTLDSTVRGIVYEAAGTVPAQLLAAGAERVRAFCEDSKVCYGLITTRGHDPGRWLNEALDAVEVALAPVS